MSSSKNPSRWGRWGGSGLSRRELFRQGSLFALFSGLLPNSAAAAASTPSLPGPDDLTGLKLYQSIGVRPIINCRGTFTIIGGSLELPEVRAAKEAAAMHFVHLDELMDAVGKRLAELTGAESGIVTAGCAAALAHATAACVATISDSNNCSGDIDFNIMRLKNGSASGLSFVLLDTLLKLYASLLQIQRMSSRGFS